MASSESKESKEHCGEDEEGLIRVERIRVGPNLCSISEPLDIVLSYSLAESVQNARWTVAYLVDSVRKRHLVQLGQAGEPSDLSAGAPQVLTFRSGSVDVEHLKPSQLCNAGLLILTLFGRTASDAVESELGCVQLVVQALPAAPSASGLAFIRSILNPWE
jgi:hypothetical protein